MPPRDFAFWAKSLRGQLLSLGDFNLPNITRGDVPKCYDAVSAVFCDVVDDCFLQQMVFEPTRGENILDLILTHTPEFLMNINVCEGLGNSGSFLDRI